MHPSKDDGSYTKWIDVSNAFLHGDSSENIYKSPLPSMLPSGDSRVCKLKKSLYGFKQVNRNWYQKLTNSLVNFGHTQSHVDYTLFFKSSGESYTYLLIYVDDFIISCNDEEVI